MAMASCSKLPAAAASAGRFQDLPAELVERIMQPLDHRDRARCEMVCTRWLAVSRRSPMLWGRVEWVYSAGDQLELAELSWLGRHGPVRQAKLDLGSYYGAEQTAAEAASALGSWADSLEVLRLTCASGTIEGLEGVLPSLAHLTQLRLYGWTWEDTAARVIGSLRQLRSLCWGADGEGDEPGPVLPAPPQLEHLRVDRSDWSLPQHLPATLLSLQIATWLSHKIGPLRGLSSLTSLVMSNNQLQELPRGLSTLTALRYLDLSNNLEANIDHEIGEVLCCMPHLEYLRLRHCNLGRLPALPQGSVPPLKALDISKNEYYGVFIPSPLWLRSLEYLQVNWSEVPSKELCAAAAKLREVAIWFGDEDDGILWLSGKDDDDLAPSEVVVGALESMDGGAACLEGAAL